MQQAASKRPAACAIKLRAFEKADLCPAYKLDQVCFPPTMAYTLPELRHFVSRPSAFALVAETSSSPVGRMAGFVVAGHNPRSKSGAAHLVTIDVAPDERRSGIATMLMDAVETHYEALGCTAIQLEVAVDNAGAHRFYTHRGFSEIGLRRGYYGGLIDAYTMSKPLAPAFRH